MVAPRHDAVQDDAGGLPAFRAGNTFPDQFELDFDAIFLDGQADVLSLLGIVEFQEASVVGS